MSIINNLNERLTILDDSDSVKMEIKWIVERTPVKLPDDYIDFLRGILGADNRGVSFEVDGVQEFVIWSARAAADSADRDYRDPIYEDFLSRTWMIGEDLGSNIYFYGEGKEGFGIYKTDKGEMNIDNAEKLADSLTDLLVKGVGLDIIFK